MSYTATKMNNCKLAVKSKLLYNGGAMGLR